MLTLRETAGIIPVVKNGYAFRSGEQNQGAAEPLRGKFPFDRNLVAKAAGDFRSHRLHITDGRAP
jgi:hypothetical protein